MNQLLMLTTYGVKNIEKPITLEFANSTIENGIKKVNNVKGIFGYNGVGKSALISSVDFYKSIVCGNNYLLQHDVQECLNKLINYKQQEFFFSIVFALTKNSVIRHSIKLNRNNITSNFVITEEKVDVSVGRTLNGDYKTLIEKHNQEISFGKNDNSGPFSFQKKSDLDYTSIVQDYFIQILDKNVRLGELNDFQKNLVILYLFADSIDVFMLDSDKHETYHFDKSCYHGLLKHAEELKEVGENNWIDHYSDEDIIPKDKLPMYEKDNIKLQKFLKLFKPEIKQIKLKKSIEGNVLHIRKIFAYDDYEVEMEFESSGIKQLVKLFSYLSRCALGNIVFIDDIDINMNTVYLEKLISFYRKYGKGQLIFTSHNIEAMEALKAQAKAIVILGVENSVDTWIGKGNISPINHYLKGNFPNSPMNIEDFDFINVFSKSE